MQITWIITPSDIKTVQDFVSQHDNKFVQRRVERNLKGKGVVINKNAVIKALLISLLTSQQRSGPNTPVGKFFRLKPFPVTIERLPNASGTGSFLREVLTEHGLTRFLNRITDYFERNVAEIEKNNWGILSQLKDLQKSDDKDKERALADHLDRWLLGLGPKQSRNFLQALGLTKYEIPIDSRITNWLNKFGFPVTLSSAPLGNVGYYHFVLDGIQQLCEKANIYPCILDAAIFSSFDKGEWDEETIAF